MIKKIFSLITVAGALLTIVFTVGVVRGDWSEPGANPPSGNVAAPINVGAIYQLKIPAPLQGGMQSNSGSIGANDFFVSSVPPAGRWVSELFTPGPDLPACLLIASTPVSNLTEYRQAVNVPLTCISDSCTLAMAVVNSLDANVDLRSTTYFQFPGSGLTGGGGAVYHWWSKPGGTGASGVNCDRGRNGTTQGCDGIMEWSGGAIRLADDRDDIENDNTKWSLRDNSAAGGANIFVCD